MTKYFRNNLIVLALAIIISLLLHVLHVLLPFMFGPIIAAIVAIKIFHLKIKWPFWLSELGLILLGVQIGSTFTKSVIYDIKDDWFTIILVTVLLLLLSLLIALLFKKIAQVNTETAILSVIPGALSQMLVMAEEDKKANIMVVSLTQTSRIIFVVVLVPFISYFFKTPRDSHSSSTEIHPNLTQALTLPNLLTLIILIALVYYAMGKINFPTKQMLAPIVVLIGWNLISGITFTLDNYIIAGAQIIYMIRIGNQIANLLDQMKGRIAVAIAVQNVLLILLALVMVYVISLFTNNMINDLFLGAAPGGMNQIVLVAIETGADVPMISSYHIFRIFFILFLIAPLLNYYLRYRASKTNSNQKQ